MTKRRSSSGKFKATVVPEALRGDWTAQEIAAKHKVQLPQKTRAIALRPFQRPLGATLLWVSSWSLRRACAQKRTSSWFCYAQDRGSGLVFRLLPGRRMQSMLPRVHEAFAGGLQVRQQGIVYGLQLMRRFTNPESQSGTVDINSFPGVNLALAMQWQMIGILRDD